MGTTLVSLKIESRQNCKDESSSRIVIKSKIDFEHRRQKLNVENRLFVENKKFGKFNILSLIQVHLNSATPKFNSCKC